MHGSEKMPLEEGRTGFLRRAGGEVFLALVVSVR